MKLVQQRVLLFRKFNNIILVLNYIFSNLNINKKYRIKQFLI